MFGGAAEMGAGGAIAYGSGGLAAPMGSCMVAHGADHFSTGLRMLITGRYSETATSQLLQKTGMSAQTASLIDSGLSMGGTMGGTALIRFNRLTVPSNFCLPTQGLQSSIPNIHMEEDWAQLSGILRRISQKKGNFYLGAATREQANVLGSAWVGEGYRISSDGTAWISSNGMRQYRPPSVKGKIGKIQANFERKFEGQVWNNWPSNGHLDILD